jgi:hypothetical protein
MAGSITTAMATSFKSDIFSGLHCFNAVTTFTATGTATQTWTAVSSLTGLAVGMTLSGTNVTANTVIAQILSGTSIFVSKASGGALGTVTATGDTFNIALFKASVTGTYDTTTNNYTQMTSNSDELPNGSGYTTGGTALTNVSPTSSGSTAFVNFSPNPSWTSASFSTSGAMIYNNSQRGPTATRTVSVHSFGGTQTVTSGTFTAVMPTAAPGSAILQIA